MCDSASRRACENLGVDELVDDTIKDLLLSANLDRELGNRDVSLVRDGIKDFVVNEDLDQRELPYSEGIQACVLVRLADTATSFLLMVSEANWYTWRHKATKASEHQ
jgi:hypothetical protein